MTRRSAEDLAGQWFHSHEEDSADLAVYRPSAFPFPRGRLPRESITLRPDGSADLGRPGPVDRAERTPGRWHLEDAEVVIDTGDGRSLRLTVGGPDHSVLMMLPTGTGGPDDDEPVGG